MVSFDLPAHLFPSDAKIPFRVPEHIPISEEQLLQFPAFQTSLVTLQFSLGLQKQDTHRFHRDPYQLKEIVIQSVHFFGPRVGFVNSSQI
jgi:hypothetical protein